MYWKPRGDIATSFCLEEMRLAGLHGNKCSIPERVAQRQAILPLWADTWRQELLAQLRQRYVGGSEIPEIPFKHETKPLFSEGGQQRNAFPGEVVGHTPLEIEKNHQISHLLWLTLLGEGGWTRWFPEVPSNLNHTVILWKGSPQSKATGRKWCCWYLAAGFGGYTKRKELLFLSSPSHPSTYLLC